MHVFIEIEGEEFIPDQVPIGALVEDGAYVIGLKQDVSGINPDLYEAFIGGTRLKRTELQVLNRSTCIRWTWRPDFRAGRFDLAIRYKTNRIYPLGRRPCLLHVIPNPEKITASHHRQMLADLQNWAYQWTPLSQSHWSAEPDKNLASPRSARMEFLIWHWESLYRLVDYVVDCPLRRLQTTPDHVRWHEITEITDQGITGLLTGASEWVIAAGKTPGVSRISVKTGGWIPAYVEHFRSVSSKHTPENAFVARFLEEIEKFLQCTGQPTYESLAPTRQQAEGLSLRVASMLDKVRRLRRDTWLGQIVPSRAIRPTIAFETHPVYSALWSLYRRWQGSFMLRDGGGEIIGVERTFQLYELWCLIQVAMAFSVQLGADMGRVMSSLISAGKNGLDLKLQPDAPQEVELPGARLYYQRTYSASRHSRSIRSISTDMTPDISVEWTGRDGRPYIVIFDAKYRVAHSGVADGIGEMHIYRDALRDDTNHRVVIGAYLLCPSEPTDRSDGKYLSAAYQLEHGLGALVVAPGTRTDSITALVRRHLPGCRDTGELASD